MYKNVIMIVLAILLLASSSVYAEASGVKVFVNQKEVISNPSAIIVNDSTFIPFRAILNALDVKDSEILWHGETSVIEIKTTNKYVFMAIGNPAIIVDKKMETLTTAPFIYENRTFIPVRAIADILGAGVEWDGQKREVHLTKAK